VQPATAVRLPDQTSIQQQQEHAVPNPATRDPLLDQSVVPRSAAVVLPESTVEKLLGCMSFSQYHSFPHLTSWPDSLPESSCSMSPSIHSGLSPSTLNDATTKSAPSVPPNLPSYLEPVPSHLAVDDLDYLYKKGSFHIPTDKFRNALICSYAVSKR
jgi:hypothetical protein